MSILHDLHQFVRQGFRRPKAPSHDVVGGLLIANFIVLAVATIVATAVLAIVFGPWLILFFGLPMVLVTVFFFRFWVFYADKHNCLRW